MFTPTRTVHGTPKVIGTGFVCGLVILALAAHAAENRVTVTGSRHLAEEGTGVTPPNAIPPDVTPPEIECPPDVSFECDAVGDFGAPRVHDDMDPEPIVTHEDHVVYFNCPFEYTTVRTWTATDRSGNSASCAQTIIVQDSTAPVLICPNDTAVACDQWNEAGWPHLYDNCNPNPHLDYEPTVVVNFERFRNKVIRYWEATDSCCNKIGCQQIVTLLDTIPPLVACGASDTIPCDWPVVFSEPSAEDNCTAEQEITLEVASLDTLPGPVGCEYTVTKCWTARDNFGNISEPCCQSISVEDCGQHMCTFTIGGWGAPCPEPQQGDSESTQPGCIRDYYFDGIFPDGVMIGDTSGADTYGAIWTTAGAVEAFLPGGGTPGMLEGDLIDPLVTPAGVVASQILALRLNREFSCAGIFVRRGLAPDGECYGGFVIPEACGSFGGLTVDEFLAVADRAISGHPEVLVAYGDSLPGLARTATCLNELYNDCEEAALAALVSMGLLPEGPLPAEPSTVSAGTADHDSLESGGSLEKGAPAAQLAPVGRPCAGAGDRAAGGVTYPNPLEASATIRFEVRFPGRVTVEIFDVRGVKVRTLVKAEEPVGTHAVIWDGADFGGHFVARGLYFCRIQLPGQPPVTEKLVKTK